MKTEVWHFSDTPDNRRRKQSYPRQGGQVVAQEVSRLQEDVLGAGVARVQLDGKRPHLIKGVKLQRKRLLCREEWGEGGV